MNVENAHKVFAYSVALVSAIGAGFMFLETRHAPATEVQALEQRLDIKITTDQYDNYLQREMELEDQYMEQRVLVETMTIPEVKEREGERLRKLEVQKKETQARRELYQRKLERYERDDKTK